MKRRIADASLVMVFVGIAVFLWVVCATPRASAIPAFARKYQTSCTTCHSNYPELNDFGEAFKKNGFKFPKDDELFIKEPPVLLGAKAQREAFPKAVFPGEIPGNIPLGFRYSGFASYNNRQPLGIGFQPRTDLFTPNTFTIIGAGSFGPNISFWVDDDISVGGANKDGGLGDGYLKVNDLGRYLHLPKDTLNVRFGQFELDLPFTQARSINPSGYDIYEEASFAGVQGTTNNPLVFASTQRGIEIGGYPNDGNFSWSLAVVNGSNGDAALRNSKDVYIRVSQRFNLERDPNVRKEIQAAGPSGPRDHSSLRLGAFYYYGVNTLNQDDSLFPGLGTLREPFYRVGGDFRFKYRQFELYGLGMVGHDSNHDVNTTLNTAVRGVPVTFSGGFGQAQYWVYPWMIAIMRYDFVNSPTDSLNGVSAHPTRSRISPGAQFLVRSNIKLVFEYQRQWQQTIPNSSLFFRHHGFVAGVDYVF
jgi:hypothetical protein